MNKNIFSIFFCLLTVGIFLALLVPSRAVSLVHSRDEFVTVDGSGAQDEMDECMSTFVGYDNTFLRGVSEEFFISYNNTEYEDCIRYCCMEKHFVCSSFSYFKAIRLCYVMNQTMHEHEVNLANVPGWKHFHKVYPEDETTANPEYYFTTDSSSISDKSNAPIDVTEDSLQTTSLDNDVTTSYDDVTTSEKMSYTDAGQVVHEVTSSNVKGGVSIPIMTSSTDSVKSLPDVETDQMMTSGDEMKHSLDGRAERLQEESRSEANCGGMMNGSCQNGGVCFFITTADNSVAVSSSIATSCDCQDGFTGEFCETSEQEAGIPPYIIALAVIGFFIFLLFATLLIVCCAYKQKTGKYSVKWRRDRWRKKTKKTQARRSQSFMSDAPFPNRMGEPAYDDSLDSPSSLTSV